MSKISLPELKKQLRTYDAETLISIIVDCYKSSEDVKKYIHMLLDPESAENELYAEAKKKILQQFYPDRGNPKLKFAEAKKAISEFSKLSLNQAKTVDLLLYYVELGVKFTNDYGDMYEAFYNSMHATYAAALKKINAAQGDGLYFAFRDRLRAIVDDTENTGWGFHEGLAGEFYEVAVNYEEDPFRD